MAAFDSADVASLRNPFNVLIIRLASSDATIPDNFCSNNFEPSSFNPSSEDEDDDDVPLDFSSLMLSLMTCFHSESVKVEFLLLMPKYNNSDCPKKMKFLFRYYFSK